MSALIQRCSQIGISVVQSGPDGYFPLSLWPPSRPLLLAEGVGAEHWELNLVTIARGREVRELMFLSPVTTQDLENIFQFIISFHRWCG